MMKSDLAGQVFGNYKLLRMIGEGGMGSVYEAEEKGIGRKVAVKILPRALAQNPNYMERFNREVKTAASLEHIHITPIYAYGEHEGMSYVVMRLLTGGDLQKRLYQLGRPSLLEAKKILEQIASALDYAHKRGVIHRDLKPSNIMFDEQGNAYLADFGIAKVVGEAGLTGTGQAIGTPSYMPPEQWVGNMVDARSDIYAFAAMTYQLLSGHTPFSANTPYELMFKHMNELPHPIHVLQPALSYEVTDVLLRGMAKDPQNRYASAGEFVGAITAAMTHLPPNEARQTGFMTVKLSPETPATPYLPLTQATPLKWTTSPSLAPPSPPSSRRANMWVWGGLSLLVLLIIVIGVIGALPDGDSSGGIGSATATLSERELAQATVNIYASQTGEAQAEQNRQATIQGEVTQIALDAIQTQVALNPPTATNKPLFDVGMQTQIAALPTATATATDKPLFDAGMQTQIAALPTATLPPTATATATDKPLFAAGMQTQIALLPTSTLPPTSTLSASEWYASGLEAYNRGDFEQAIADYDRAIELDPSYWEAYSSRAFTYYYLGQFEAAMADYDRALELDPNSAWAYNYRAATYYYLGQLEAALADYDRAIELDPSYRDAYNSRGFTYASLGQLEAALADYDRAIELDPSYRDAYINRGLTYSYLGDYEAALADYDRAIELDTAYAWGYSHRGLVHYQLKNYDQAIADYRTYEELTGQLEPFMVEGIAEMEAALGGSSVRIPDSNLNLPPLDATFEGTANLYRVDYPSVWLLQEIVDPENQFIAVVVGSFDDFFDPMANDTLPAQTSMVGLVFFPPSFLGEMSLAEFAQSFGTDVQSVFIQEHEVLLVTTETDGQTLVYLVMAIGDMYVVGIAGSAGEYTQAELLDLTTQVLESLEVYGTEADWLAAING